MKRFLFRIADFVLPILVFLICLVSGNTMHTVVCVAYITLCMVKELVLMDKYYQLTCSAILDGCDQETISAQIQSYPIPKALKKELAQIANSYY